MPFQIHPVKEFLVRPALPPAIARMSDLAYNLLWSWDHTVRSLFRRLDSVLWKNCGHNPVLMLGRVPQATLERAAGDPRFLGAYRKACERFTNYLERSEPSDDRLIAYFSMEYGMVECMPIYGGGLGVLSGDHLKAASDGDVPLAAVGLLYQKGYLQQALNPDGWQQERNPVNDFYTLPVRPVCDKDGRDMTVQVTLPTGVVTIKIWQIAVGRVKLYLLDTNIPENERIEHREITDQLYGGDILTRIRQEIVLGIGGLRALARLGLKPTVWHMNEGHSAFLAIERMRRLIQEYKLSFDDALEACRSNSIFTTHTSVPAGIDLFEPGLLYEYFGEYCAEAGIPFEKFLALGRFRPENHHEPFSMAICAIQTSAFRNAVSTLHRQVSQEMWQELWPKLPVWEVPITSVTNGVHLLTWLNGDLALLYDQHLQPDWRDRNSDPRIWDLVDDIPAQELWEAHRRRKRYLVSFVRERVVAAAVARKASSAEQRRLAEVLDPDTFTIGFARRFATYKRATLLFRDIERLKRLLTNPDRPVQIVIAGKAHPRDLPGKTLIREIVQLSRAPELAKHIVFVEDYSIEVAREMVQGVDLWLNTPRRGEEACGTSGMKAGVNGVLNLSILDGWFDEGYEISGGWAIGDREPYSEDQDEIHARAIYSILENEIVPMYYQDREGGVPTDWVRRVKQSLKHLSHLFNSGRMVGEYLSQLYEPAHQAYLDISHDRFQPAHQRANWNQKVHEVWDKVGFVEIGPGPDVSVLTGVPIPLRAVVDLAGLSPGDVRVEAVVGRIGVNGNLEETQVMSLPAVEQNGTGCVFLKEFVPHQTGRLGYSLRISPNHYDDPLTRPCNSLLKWSGE
ncbi:MAG TPA: alpha-glucan family phosphorylase [Bryobacteraceae bacterium]|jgi:glycogen phosphorylase|nr:alpha-glucan family phosphorylase [Bryobacteraceae bacterium]